MRVSSVLSLLALAQCNAAAAVEKLVDVGVSIKDNAAHVMEKRASGTGTVNLASLLGSPQHLASGFIYGLPDTLDGSASSAIPYDLATGTGYKYCRAGGAQMPSPNLGYASGQLGGRLASFMSNYRTSRIHGARFQLLVHDLWGADSVQGTIPWPGNGGSWSQLDDFMGKVIGHIKANSLQDGLELDLWNEPDASQFWGASYDQYLATWTRMYQRFKNELPGVPVLGPSISQPPHPNNARWTAWLDHVKKTNTIPDIYTYHVLTAGPDHTIRGAQDNLRSMTSGRGLPMKPVNVNEYGASNLGDQTNAGSAWFIGALERENAKGLRAHWGMGYASLHNGMAGLVNLSGSNYFRSAQWWVYNYYTKVMTGNRAATTSSDDRIFEVYATRGSAKNTVKVLVAARPCAGLRTYDLTIRGLSAVGATGTVRVRTLRFNHVDWWETGPAPTDLGVAEHVVSNDQITFWVTPDNEYTAYAFEIVN